MLFWFGHQRPTYSGGGLKRIKSASFDMLCYNFWHISRLYTQHPTDATSALLPRQNLENRRSVRGCSGHWEPPSQRALSVFAGHARVRNYAGPVFVIHAHNCTSHTMVTVYHTISAVAAFSLCQQPAVRSADRDDIARLYYSGTNRSRIGRPPDDLLCLNN